MTSNEAQTTTSPTFNPETTEAPYIWEGKAGGAVDARSRSSTSTRAARVDREAAQKGVAFMERNVKAKTPFFLYYPITQIHFPTLAHPDFAGKTGAGDIGDAMADVDYNAGLILDAIDKLGIERNTIVLLVHRQRRRDPAAVARLVRAVERVLQHRHGRRHPHAVHHPLAGTDSGGTRHERDRAPAGHLPDARRRRRRAATSSRRIARSTA